MDSKIVRNATVIAFMALVAIACASSKEPAQAAIAEAESALQGIANDAQKYVPDQYREAEATLAAARAEFDQRDYKAALAHARELSTKITAVGAAAAAAKNEALARLGSEWNALSADVPQMVQAIESRVSMLSKSRQLPKNIDQASFDAAKTGLDAMKQTWTAATQAFAGGNLDDAVAKAKAVQQQGMEVLGKLGMQKPAA